MGATAAAQLWLDFRAARFGALAACLQGIRGKTWVLNFNVIEVPTAAWFGGVVVDDCVVDGAHVVADHLKGVHLEQGIVCDT